MPVVGGFHVARRIEALQPLLVGRGVHVGEALDDRPALWLTRGGTICGPFLGVWLSLVAVSLANTAAAAVLVPLLLLAALPARASDAPEGLRALVKAGETAPAFSLRDVDGNDVSFRPGDGRPALVVFWSVFCPMCRELMPRVNGFAGRHGATVRVVGVNLYGKRFSAAVRSYLAEAALRFPVGLDDLRGDFFVASDPFGVEKTPTAVLVDGGGTVRGAWAAGRIREFLSEADAIVATLQQGESRGQ